MKSILLTATQVLLTLFLYAAGALVIALALFPSAIIVLSVYSNGIATQTSSGIFFLCLTIGAAYFLF
jgi:hypothetical protein